MTTLRQKMAENGFESNENYDYITQCLQASGIATIPCLNVEGETGRRKTAFATALAQSLDIQQRLYHDFTREEETKLPQAVKTTSTGNEHKEQPPICALDRILSDACAYSEAEKTILILDQLQAADFKDHIRLYRFLVSHEWAYHDNTFHANPKNLTLFLISEELIYHSLQKNSFKVWINSSSNRSIAYQPADFQLNVDAQPLLETLDFLFKQLEVIPTYSEYRKIITDIQQSVHTAADLCFTLYGRTEGLHRKQLHTAAIQEFISQTVMPVIETFIGITETVEISSDNIPE